MKKLLLIALMVSGISCALAQTRKVKFSVDMTGQIVNPSQGVTIVGNFQGWKPGKTSLYRAYPSDIYYVIVDVAENTLVEYKFINGKDWYQIGENVPAFSRAGHFVNGGSNDSNNRWAFVAAGKDTLDLGAVTFSGTAPSGKYAVRLAVDMAKESAVSSKGVCVVGDFQGWELGKTRMANLYSANKIYEAIVFVTSGTYAYYKFMNGNRWGDNESVPSDCATDNNRKITDGNSDKAIKVCYRSCSVCPSAYNITFQVDMSTNYDFDTVDIAGDKINGWSGGTYLNKGANGIWSVTLTLDSGEIQYKYRKIKGGNPSSEVLANRVFVPNSDTTLALHCFDSYTKCTPIGGGTSVSRLTSEVTIAPNPAFGSFNVSLAGSKISKVVIISLHGRIVRSLSAKESTINVNVNGLNGVYFVNITDNIGRTATKKIVLQ